MKPLLKIIKHTKELRSLYIGIGIFTIIGGLLGLARPLIFGRIVDEIAKGISSHHVTFNTLIVLGTSVFVIDILMTVLGNIAGYVGDLMATKLKRHLSEEYYSKLLYLPQSYFDNELTGTVVNRLTRGIDSITRFMQMMSNNFLSMFLTIFFSIIYMAKYSWPVAVMVTLLIPLYFLVTRKVSASWQIYEKEINGHMDRSSGRFAESIGQVKVVKSFVQELRELTYFKKQYKEAYGITKKQSKLWHREDIKRKSVLNAINFAVLGVLVWQASKGTITAGQFTTIIFLVNTMSFPIANMSFIIENAQRAIAGSSDYFGVIELEPSIRDSKSSIELNVHSANVTFEGVYFGYDEEKMVLKNVSFEVENGTRVALVGESGEGKTTITNLLMRLYEPQKGTISIAGVSVASVTQKSLRNSIGAVFQDPALFSGTIFENISYAKPKATMEEVLQAAKSANAHEFIEKLDKGYESEIGERGVKLSGGQKQRIAIARALLKDAPLLVLDEATSSLDSKSESLVQEALDRLMQNRTTIIIAHRLSTIAGVDRIITVRRGRIDEVGTPKDLAKSGGIYSQLLALQNRSSEDVKKQLQAFELSS